MRKYYLLLLLLHAALVLHAQVSYKTVADVSYVSPDESDAYRRERCKLDVYYPEGATNCPTAQPLGGPCKPQHATCRAERLVRSVAPLSRTSVLTARERECSMAPGCVQTRDTSLS